MERFEYSCSDVGLAVPLILDHNDTLTETKGDRPACLGPFVVTIVIYFIYTSRYAGAFCFASILIFLIVN